jgi:uncharacterized heparinase superfamily protein
MQQIVRRREGLSAEFLELACNSIARQLCYLERDLEKDIGCNHLVKNIKALIWGSTFFSGAAERWRETGVELLAQVLAEQVLPDGMHYERSTSYHCQVLADLLECRYALGGDPLGGVLDDALRSMVGVAADLAHLDGEVALFNDAGLAMAYSPRECLAVYFRLLGRPPKRRRIFALESAGYFGMREDGNYFIADCGPIAPDALVAHAHGDILSFEWSVAGKRIVVDQGVYEYNAGARRQAARSAASHNTLSIEGADQADLFGAFRCGRRPTAEVLRHQESEDGFVLEGAHNGYATLPGKPQHARRFEVSRHTISILDLVEGRPEKPVSIGFLLHPKCRVDIVQGVPSLPPATSRSDSIALRRFTAKMRCGGRTWVWRSQLGALRRRCLRQERRCAIPAERPGRLCRAVTSVGGRAMVTPPD